MDWNGLGAESCSFSYFYYGGNTLSGKIVTLLQKKG